MVGGYGVDVGVGVDAEGELHIDGLEAIDEVSQCSISLEEILQDTHLGLAMTVPTLVDVLSFSHECNGRDVASEEVSEVRAANVPRHKPPDSRPRPSFYLSKEQINIMIYTSTIPRQS